MHILIAGPVDVGEFSDWLAAEGVPAVRGGPSVTRLVLGLIEAGHQVTVATTSVEVAAGAAPVEVGGHGPLKLVVGPLRPTGRARDAFAVERAFFTRVVDQVGADVVHAHWTYEEALGCLKARPDSVVTARDWGPAVLRLHRHPYRVVRLGMQIVALRKAATVTAPSPYMADRASRVHRGEVTVIPNPIAARDIRPGPRERMDAPTLVAVNNGFTRIKNVDTLLASFAQVRKVRPDAQLELFGDGYGPGGPADRWARAQGVSDGCDFRGRVPLAEVIEAMERAAIFVHAAREESFGNVLVEALARATPIVAGRRSGAVPWVVGDAGLLVDVESPREIADAILRLLEDPGLWRECSVAAHNAVTTRFRTDAVVAQYEGLYRSTAPPVA